MSMRKPASVDALTRLGRVQLSRSFFMRDFLYSEIAQVHGILNAPDDPDLAIAAGTRLCEDLLEPLQDAFGRLAIRGSYRSAAVNGLGNKLMRQGQKAYNCAMNETSGGEHIWDRLDERGFMGATACITVPRFLDRHHERGDWVKLAWWIHDHLPYSNLCFFPVNWAFNIGWHEVPRRRINSFVHPRGLLTKPGMDNHDGSHEAEWRGIV
jgi:hypothetical protein